jgi:hypothetical protein
MNSAKSNFFKTIVPLTAMLLCACHKEEPQPVAAPPAVHKPAIVSAEKNSFDEVTSQLDPGGNLYLYLSTEKVLAGLADKLTSISNFLSTVPGVADQSGAVGKALDFFGSWIKDSGVEQISGVGMSSIARETNFFYSKLIVHHYPGQNQGIIWSVMGKEAHPLNELDLLPEDTAMANFLDLDLPLVWSDLQKRAKQLNVPGATDAMDKWPELFRDKTGLEWDSVLSSLGGNYGIVLTLDPEKKISLPLPTGAMEIPSPGLAIVMKVNSDVIFNRVDALAKGNPLVVRTDTADLKMRTMTLPIPLPIELRPSIARSGDYLFLSTSDTMIEDMLAVKAGKKKGFKSTAEFAHLSQGIPDKGNNFSLVAAQFMKSMTEIQSQALTNQGTLSAAQVHAMQSTFSNGTNGGNFSVGANGPEGWAGYANGSQSLQSAIIPAVVGIGVAAAIVIPSLVKAHQAAAHKTAFVPPGNPEKALPAHQVYGAGANAMNPGFSIPSARLDKPSAT